MRKLSLLMIQALLLTGMASSLEAAQFFDLYAGTSQTEDATFTFVDLPVGNSLSLTADYDSTYNVGMRAGTWYSDSSLIGLAGDISYFRAESAVNDVETIPFSVLLLFRVPPETRKGGAWEKLEPYAGIGVGYYFYELNTTEAIVGEEMNGWSGDTGVDARLGLAWKVGASTHLFGEYRYTSFDVNGDWSCWLFCSGAIVRTEGRIDTHHVNIGLSFR